jgi:hypothetical protein
MLCEAALEIAGDAGVETAVSFAAEDVDVIHGSIRCCPGEDSPYGRP